MKEILSNHVYSYLYKGVQLQHDLSWYLNINANNSNSRRIAMVMNIGIAGSKVHVPTEKQKKLAYIN